MKVERIESYQDPCMAHTMSVTPTPDVVASKVYIPEEESIRVHQMHRVQCPLNLPNGFYWHGRNQASPQKYPRWVEELTPVLPGDAREGGRS